MGASDRHDGRVFLFLQGPHGPFFAQLAGRLTRSGAAALRLGFNRADELFWRGDYIAVRAPPETLAARLETLILERGVTDIVCYGSSRPVHRIALAVAHARGLKTHVFEEGYLRPYWVTYERGGANAASPVTRLSLEQMTAALAGGGAPAVHEAPDRWGDMRAHMFWGAAYHAVLLAGNRGYPGFRPHRRPDLLAEFLLHLTKLAATPVRAVSRGLATLRVRHGGFPYHLVLLQLAHDANFLDHGPFPDQAAFLERVFRGFADGAPAHHHLVLKAHPLEDGREPLRPLIRRLTAAHGLEGRVHFLAGGKLARLLDTARTALTVNSTAAEQALWRAKPLRAFGRAVYNRPEFVSHQPLRAFFRDPRPPDRDAYLIYRRFLLATSQVSGGFYGVLSRRKLLRQIPDLMLAEADPYAQVLGEAPAAGQQHIRLVR